MFLSVCSPISSKIRLIFPAASSCTRSDTQIPPGSAIPSSRAAMLTPSPKMSPSCSTMSPTLMPILNSRRLSSPTSALRPAMPACTSTAQRTASTTLANSASNPSPVVLTIRPRCSAIEGSKSSRRWRLRLRGCLRRRRPSADCIRRHQPQGSPRASARRGRLPSSSSTKNYTIRRWRGPREHSS